MTASENKKQKNMNITNACYTSMLLIQQQTP